MGGKQSPNFTEEFSGKTTFTCPEKDPMGRPGFYGLNGIGMLVPPFHSPLESR